MLWKLRDFGVHYSWPKNHWTTFDKLGIRVEYYSIGSLRKQCSFLYWRVTKTCKNIGKRILARGRRYQSIQRQTSSRCLMKKLQSEPSVKWSKYLQPFRGAGIQFSTLEEIFHIYTCSNTKLFRTQRSPDYWPKQFLFP